jgi:hypothetical protein
MVTVEHKRGATLSYSAAVTDETTGAAVDLTGYTVTAQLRSRVGLTLVATATVTLADQGTSPGVFSVTVDAATPATWTAGDVLVTDVRLVEPGGAVRATQTIAIAVVERVTTS